MSSDALHTYVGWMKEVISLWYLRQMRNLVGSDDSLFPRHIQFCFQCLKNLAAGIPSGGAFPWTRPYWTGS